MQDLVKYVMGVASKSNVEKRQVGCILVDEKGQIHAEGFNDEQGHAEWHACQYLVANADYHEKIYGKLTAYVTHPPCPECAKLMTEHNVGKVEVVEAFMKFDGDKPRYDLIDGTFAFDLHNSIRMTSKAIPQEIRNALWLYAALPEPKEGKVNCLNTAVTHFCSNYPSSIAAERAIVDVLTFGARKYKPNNWKTCKDTGRYLAAAHRHCIAIIEGEDIDEESGLPHMAHVGCNLMFLSVLGYSNEATN